MNFHPSRLNLRGVVSSFLPNFGRNPTRKIGHLLARKIGRVLDLLDLEYHLHNLDSDHSLDSNQSLDYHCNYRIRRIRLHFHPRIRHYPSHKRIFLNCMPIREYLQELI